MARLNNIRIGASTPRGPAIPAGGPRQRPAGQQAPIYRDKKRYAGSVAGMRGQRPYSVSRSNIPYGPRAHPFTSVQLGKRLTGPAAPPKPAPRTSLLNRIAGRARSLFGR